MDASAPAPAPLAPADWIQPDWPAPPGVQALCTTRAGGVSRAPYDSLNLGSHVGDDPGAVRANRARLETTLRELAPGTRPVFLDQVHGDGVVHLDTTSPDGVKADACTAAAPGVACTIMVADCLPVLWAHRSGAVVAAAHAGWRGLAGTGGQGVLESVFQRFQALAQDGSAQAAIKTGAYLPAAAAAADILVWLGPCIGPQAFEVGAEVRDAFCRDDPGAQACFVARPRVPGKYLCDLAGLARRRLQALGVTHIYGNDGTGAWCTVTHASRFFSHRRDAAALGGSGRLAACIWRT